jgi:hypothetical protein
VVELDFGERVMHNKTNDQWASLSELFTISYIPSDRNFSFLDLMYDVNGGRLYIIGEVVDFTEPLLVNFEVAAGAVADLVGNPCEGEVKVLSIFTQKTVA